MNRFFRNGMFIILVSSGVPSLGTCTVQKVLNTQTHSSDKGPYIELGSLAFCFDSYPAYEQLSFIPGAHGERRTFFFRDAQVQSTECRDKIESVNKFAGRGYTIRIMSVTKPTKGIQVEITYDPQTVAIEARHWDAITTQPTIVFTFYNKKFINQLEKKPKEIISLASRSDAKTVVIDCGHGGTDCGAIGCNGVAEKEVSLHVGLELAKLLTDGGFRVALSRSDDRTVSLDERSTFANRTRADVLVSVHANHAARKDVCGVETYCILPPLIHYGLCTLDARDMKSCHATMRGRCQKSFALAHAVHTELVSSLRTKHHVTDRHVRHAVPNVLMAANMPGILVEVGFLSHPREAQLLADAGYRKEIARGISRGISSFFQTSEQVL